MSEKDLEEIAEKADIIVSGYAFTKQGDEFIRILNLEHPDCAMVINNQQEIIETNMDEIEQKIVLNLLKKNFQFLIEHIPQKNLYPY